MEFEAGSYTGMGKSVQAAYKDKLEDYALKVRHELKYWKAARMANNDMGPDAAQIRARITEFEGLSDEMNSMIDDIGLFFDEANAEREKQRVIEETLYALNHPKKRKPMLGEQAQGLADWLGNKLLRKLNPVMYWEDNIACIDGFVDDQLDRAGGLVNGDWDVFLVGSDRAKHARERSEYSANSAPPTPTRRPSSASSLTNSPV